MPTASAAAIWGGALSAQHAAVVWLFGHPIFFSSSPRLIAFRLDRGIYILFALRQPFLIHILILKNT